MRIVVTRPSAAAPAVLWAAVADLPSWPQWCPAFSVVQPEGRAAVGTRVRVLQPGMRLATWTIDEMIPERVLRWSNSGPGFRMVAERRLEPDGGGTMIRLSLTVTGTMAWAVSLISRRPLRRYLGQEARCLADLAGPATRTA